MWCHLEYFSFNFSPFFWLLKKSNEVVSFLAEFSIMFGEHKVLCDATKWHWKIFRPVFCFCISYFNNPAAAGYQWKTWCYCRAHHHPMHHRGPIGDVLNPPDVRTSVPCPGWTCDQQVSAKRDSCDGVTESSLAQFLLLQRGCFVDLIGLNKHLHWCFRTIFTLPLYPT